MAEPHDIDTEPFQPWTCEPSAWPEHEKQHLLRDPVGVREILQKTYPLASARLLDRLANLVVQTAQAVVSIEAEASKAGPMSFEETVDHSLAMQGVLLECIADTYAK